MSSLTVVQSKSSNQYNAATSYKSHTFASACTIGNSVVLIITAQAAELPFAIEPKLYNGTTDTPMLLIATDTTSAGMTRHLYKLDNIPTAATSIRYKVSASAGNSQLPSDAWEIGNTGGAALTIHVDQKTSKTTATSFSENFTTVTPNEMAIVHLRSSQSNPPTFAGANYTLVTHANVNVDSLYRADTGPSGANTVSWTTTASTPATVWITTFSNTSATPTVTSVTGSTVTEGVANRFTIALSGTTTADSDYAISWGGTAVNGTDYNNDLTAATFGTGLSFVGGKIRFATGYNSGYVDVPTVDNALDQPDRTLILTVGGVASTGGLITDNDAPPVVTFTDGVESFGVVTCVATLGAVSGKDVSFQVDTTNGTKTAGTNYTAIVAQTVTIPAGSLTAAVTANTL